jgi:hydroxyacylglutathione hydrolase
MRQYMTSLDRLMARDHALYLPGHGGPVMEPAPYLEALKAHRKARERALLDQLAKGPASIREMVATIYRDVDPALHGAAALSMLAQAEWLVERGLILAGDTVPDPATRLRLA